MPWAKDDPCATPRLVEREWLVSNGLGGYASGTVAGVCSRRFHGILVAALPAPLGRVMMLNHVAEEIGLPDGTWRRLGSDETAEGRFEEETLPLAEFRLESGLPVWRFELGGWVLEKRVVLPHLQNTVFLSYSLVEGSGPVHLRARPSVHFRPHEGRVDEPLVQPYDFRAWGGRFEVSSGASLPRLKLLAYGDGAAFVLDGGRFRQIFYRMEQNRGYDARGTLWSPGYARADLSPGRDASLGASTESWETFSAMDPREALATELERRARLLSLAHPSLRRGPVADLVLAADQFIITPNVRVLDAARTRAMGDDVRSVIAGYHWFTDWGRDTMISLEGLALATGRSAEAGCILRMFGRHVRDGLLPNLFPEGRQQGLYHSADATLWFFHALDRYLKASRDQGTLELLMPKLREIVERHVAGTRFGIRVDPEDGLLTQGEAGYQLTWMDAKVGDWVVTPRRGKAVEVNALWYNAVKLMERWTLERDGPGAAQPYGRLAERARESFNRRFWNEATGCLFDVLDGDPAEAGCVRPNQILAMSLPHAVLDPSRWQQVLAVVERDLLTPVGLRSLAPHEPNFRQRYDGNLRDRDAAYHQGTVWAWLIGPFVDAWLRVHPEDKAGARRRIDGILVHLSDACVGSVSEIFDAEEPFTPRGCVAQAWSVAEALRAWVKTEP
ncbi:MAG: glycogen debranching enzyme family protein [Proteobacteria bacterium]|nr:glycogen debranching enzyme family protein [Pseudomonadota bacterium]